MSEAHDKAPEKIYLQLLPGRNGDHVGDYEWMSPLLAPDPIEYVKVASVRATVERVARTHDELAAKYPNGPDRVKALTLRRFAEVFLQ
jgi:hypothetical protein